MTRIVSQREDSQGVVHYIITLTHKHGIFFSSRKVLLISFDTADKQMQELKSSAPMYVAGISEDCFWKINHKHSKFAWYVYTIEQNLF